MMIADSTPNEIFDETISEPPEEYAFLGNVLPDEVEEYRSSDSDQDRPATKDVRVDWEAYSELTKADPHYRTHFRQSGVEGERWSADYLYLKKRDYFQMLGEIHRGEKNGPKWEHTELKTYEIRRFLTENIGGRLNLTKLQLKQAVARATNVDAERLGESLTLVVYCTCAYVVQRDESSRRKCHYNTPAEKKDELFVSVAEQLNLRQRNIRRVYAKLENRFHDITPPVEFDKRKPNWEPDKSNPELKDELFGQPPKPLSGGGVYKPLSVTLG